MVSRQPARRSSSRATSWTRQAAATTSCCSATERSSRRATPAELRERTGLDDLEQAFLRLAEERRMSLRITAATALRVLRQLRHDPRTLALIVFVPCLLITLLKYVFLDSPVFDRIGGPLVGLFPLMSMFVVTSITMLRERTTGTLERLMTMPLVQARPPARLRGGVRARRSGAGGPRLGARVRRARPRRRRSDVGRDRVSRSRTRVLGMALGLFVSAFARSEFQAVQFLPAFILPQILLCGLLAPRDEMAAAALRDLVGAPGHVRVRRARPRHAGCLRRELAVYVSVVCGFIAGALVLGAGTLSAPDGLASSRSAAEGHPRACRRSGCRRRPCRAGRDLRAPRGSRRRSRPRVPTDAIEAPRAHRLRPPLRRRREAFLRSRRRAGRCRGSRTLQPPRAAPGIARSSSTTAIPDASASSLSAVATPPRVGSRMKRSESPSPTSEAASSCTGAVSEREVGLEREAAARDHHGHAVVADRPGREHAVSVVGRARVRGRRRRARRRRLRC